MRKHLFGALCLGIVLTAAALAQQDTAPATGSETAASEPNSYVGSQVCSSCHEATYKQWLLTPHRRTLAEGRKPEVSGCESCHGPGGHHVAGGGDKTKIIRLAEVSSKQVTETCLKCHRQPEVMLFRTATHATAKVKCTDCHDVHSSGSASMLRSTEGNLFSIRGLNQQIEETRHALDVAKDDKARTKAREKLTTLQAKKTDLETNLNSPETRTRRATESELCFSCHKDQRAQFNMPNHHPVKEGRMECSSCHNPHGGAARSNLREESVNQTCFKCHPEFAGPYLFEHPPVEEDCTICHKPHGSAQNYLLRQSEPFLCLKCHVGPHSRSKTFQITGTINQYYWQCTSCHNRPHGSDRHSAFHY